MMGFLDNAGLAHVWAKVKTALSGKQDKLTGTAGQMVGFDAQGEAVAQDAPEGGITQEEADGRYLQLTGGTMTGALILGTKIGPSHPIVKSDINTSSYQAIFNFFSIKNFGYGAGIYMSLDDGMTEVNVTHEDAILSGVATPKETNHAANKKYVDNAIAAALNGSNEAKQEERIEISYSEGATSSSFTLTGNFANKRVIIALARYSNRDTVLAQYIVDYTISEPPVSYEYSGGFSFERYGNQIMYYGESLSQVNAILITEF